MRRNWFLRGLGMAALAVVGLAVIGQGATLLWNSLMPTLFGLHALTFWQTLGLLLLSRLFLGGFRGGGFGGPWRRRMRDRWDQMTPEQREKFREDMRQKCQPGFNPVSPQP